MMRAVVSFAALQLGWFACVLGAAHGHPFIGPLFVLATLFLHLRVRRDRTSESIVLGSAVLMGLVVDTVLMHLGVLVIPGAVSPAWLVALWPNVAAATARGGSLASLARHRLLAALLGMIGAPFAYDAGARLGALALGNNRLSCLAAIGLAWAGVLPLVFGLRAAVARWRPVGE